MIATETSTTRTCRLCARVLPIERFRRRVRGEDRRRRWECSACASRERVRQKSRHCKRELRSELRRLAREPDSSRIPALLGLVARKAGGYPALADMIHEHLASTPPGSREGMLASRLLMRLMGYELR